MPEVAMVPTQVVCIAPAADRSVGLDGRFVGFLSEVEQAGIGVLSIAPQPADT
eukprot:COSAG01_NODE_59175_length_301_cov_8.133663_1_plen_53_part_00